MRLPSLAVDGPLATHRDGESNAGRLHAQTLPRNDLTACRKGRMLDVVKRILTLEDEGCIRELLVETFAGAGLDMLEATNPDEAVRLLDNPDNVDLVFTDIQVPGRTGGDLVANTAKRSHRCLPVIYMTGHPSSLRNPVWGTGRLHPKALQPLGRADRP